jgi:hypothetical protein
MWIDQLQRSFFPVLVVASWMACLGGCGGSSDSDSVAASNPPPALSSDAQVFAQDSAEKSNDSAAPNSSDLVSYGGESGGASYTGESPAQPGMPDSGYRFMDSPDGGDDDQEVFGGGAIGGSGMGASRGPPARGRSAGPGGMPSGVAGRGMPSGGPSNAPGGLNMGGSDDLDMGMEFPGMGFGQGGLGRPGMGGPAGGQNQTGFPLVSAFVQQNCATCHGALNPKGNFRLDQLNPEMSSSSDLWQSVLFQLESGSMPPANSRQPDPVQKTMVVQFIRESLGSEAELDYLQQAENAYKRGERDKATELFYAHALSVDDSQAPDVLNHIKLYRPKVAKPEDLVASNEFGATIRPRLDTELTFAVGILLDVSGQVTDVKPIGAKQMGGAGGGDLGGMQGIGRGSGGDGDSSKLEAFEDLTGDFGKELLIAFNERLSSGKFGSLFAELRADAFQSGDAGAAGPTFGGPGNGAPGFGESPDDFEAANMGGGGVGLGGTLDEPGGLGAPGRGAPGRGAPGRGAPGRGAPGMGGLGMGGMGMSAPGGSDSGKTLANEELASGLTYLGVGSLNDLLQDAVELGVDGLFLFDIKSSLNARTRIVNTDTRLRFMLVSGRVVATAGKTLTNIDIERAIQQNKGGDEVVKQLEQFFDRLDEILVFERVPNMPDTAALKHIHGQYHDGVDPLRLMAEARLFHANGIINSDQLSMIYQVVLEGNEGITLAQGSEADRKLVLSMVMPEL